MSKEKMKEILYKIKYEFENEIDDYETLSGRELSDDDINIMFEFLDNYIEKVVLTINEE